MHTLKLPFVFLLTLLAAACGSTSGSPTSPSTPATPPSTSTPPPPTAAVTYTLSGSVTITNTSTPIPGAVVRVVDGPNAGASASTDGNGRYAITGLQRAGFSVAVDAAGYTSDARGITLTSNGTANFSLLPAAAWSKRGSGDTVFDLPTYIRRVRIVGDYGGRSSNFIVHIGGAHIVNELLGTSWSQPHFEGVYLTSGGIVEITNSSGVSWTFSEER